MSPMEALAFTLLSCHARETTGRGMTAKRGSEGDRQIGGDPRGEVKPSVRCPPRPKDFGG